MTKTLLSTLALVLAAGCAKSDSAPSSDERASQALQALSARDDERVARCNQAADTCTQNVPSSAGTDACTRLADHCTSLQQRLEDVRSPAMGCWRAVQECAAHAPEQAQCRRDPAECESTEDQVDAQREPLVSCSERVEACLARVAELPTAAAVSCENISAACERAASGNGGADAGSGEGEDEQGEDEDEGGADGARRGQGNGNGGDRPRGSGNTGRSDAGVAD